MSKSKVSGFKELSTSLGNISVRAKPEVAGILEFNAGRIEAEAKNNAPGSGDIIETDYGHESTFDEIVKGRGWVSIHQAIGVKVENGGLKVSVYVDKSAGDIAAWIEFGTGQSARSYLVTVPKEWRDIARKFYVNGQGTIVQAAYLLPAYNKYRLTALKEIEDYLKTLKI